MNRIVIAASGLPPAPSGRTYQLWGIASGSNPVSLGTFDPGADGRTTLALDVPAGAVFDLAAVSEEPAGGSPQPTTTPILAGAWRAE
jgi:anti-sigma-K factor RskA